MTSADSQPNFGDPSEVVQPAVAEPAVAQPPGGGFPPPPAAPLPTDHYVVTEAERSMTLSRLVRAASSGQMTLEEFSRRTDIAVAATTRADLVAVTGDIDAGPVDAHPLKRHWWLLLGHKVKRGRFVLPEKSTAVIFAGEIHLDLRQATMIGPEPTIKVWVLAGNLSILVPRGVRVEIDQSSLFGGRTITDHDRGTSAAAPTLRIRMIDVLGSVKVTSDAEVWGRGLVVKAPA